MRNTNTRKGFTTVELVIVIAVIAILATVLIPTFSNMIEAANLSVDKQNVRNMNVCLTTYSITDGNPSDAALVKARLREYGYDGEGNFAAKTKGHSYWWYTDDMGTDDKADDISVILLVDGNLKVVYPEEYVSDTPIDTATLKYYNLSAPLANVTNLGASEEGYFITLVLDNMKALMEEYAQLDNDTRNNFKSALLTVFGPNGIQGTPDYYESEFIKIKEGLIEAIETLQEFGLPFAVTHLDNELEAIADNFDSIFGQYAEVYAMPETTPEETANKQAEINAVLDKIIEIFDDENFVEFSIPLEVKYSFVTDEVSDNYADWHTTFWVSIEGVESASLMLAGYYDGPQYHGGWKPLMVNLRAGTEVDLIKEFVGERFEFTYDEVRELVGEFTCGVIDADTVMGYETGLNPAGAKLTVELRMTNRENADETRTIGVYSYTFQ